MAVGEPLGITPYGTETLHILRAEKGYPIIGQETDGTVTPQDLGMAWAVSTRKDLIGRRSQRRPDTPRADRKQLVGLLPVDPGAAPRRRPIGGPRRRSRHHPGPDARPRTSSYRSAALGRTFALALVKGGRDRIGAAGPRAAVDGGCEAESSVGSVRPENLRRDGARRRRGARRMTDRRGLRRPLPLEGVGLPAPSASCRSSPRSTSGRTHRMRPC